MSVRRVADRSEVRRLGGGAGVRPNDMAFSPNGQFLVARYGDTVVCVWGPKQSEPILEIAMPPGPSSYSGQIFSADSRQLLVRTAKGGRPRRIVLDEEFAAALHAANKPAFDGPQFPMLATGSGGRVGGNQLLAYMRYASRWLGGAQYRFHDLRHTAAQRVYAATASTLEVMKLLGHTSLSTTHAYLMEWHVVSDSGPEWRTPPGKRPNLKIVG